MAMLQMTWQPSLLKSLKRKHGSPPLGLRNLGNTCYLNSVLQCLTFTPPLANFCLRFLHSSVCDFGTGKEKKGDCPFCLLEKRIARSLSGESVSDAPIKINSCLRIYAEHFRSGRQEDAHEFLRYVIDACHNTCLRLKKLQQQQRGKNGTANSGDIAGAGETVIKEIFGGTLQSQVKCLACGAESNKVDEIMDISLDILHSGSLREALQKFFQPEVLDGNNKYKCENCKKLVTARKQMSILEAPNVLVIQLKRFEGILGSKIDKLIAFGEVLVLSSYMFKGSKDQQPEYNLFGTIVHSGFSPDSGHYYAYIKDAIGRWYCCNDSYVSVSTLQEVLSEKVYILFFSRAKQRPRTQVDAVVNGSKTHESNGNKISTMPKSGSIDKVSNHLQETNKSTNGSRSLIKKSGCAEKPFSMKISANRSETNRSYNIIVTNVTKARTCQRSGHVETPANAGDLSDNQPETCKISGACVRQVDAQESSTHHSQTSDLVKSKIDHERPSQQRTFNDSGSTSKVLGHGNFQKKESPDEKERTGLSGLMSDTKCTGKASADIQSTGKGLSCLPEENASAHMTDSRKTLNCQGPLSGNIGASNNSCVKRKIKDGCPCIFFAKDDQSRARVETFKESIENEASMILRSCGWSEEVHSFMHAAKKSCQETGNSALNDHERKSLLISQAKRALLSKVPESLKAKLIERLKLFSQETQLSET
ncbi:ubiquitin carboxyl-terminal hydrolase 25-like isoform X1 [Salvia splendens]|uniref:ubiquitin carboxyl-terminal hydrolase 25-like isoform X1 n=1 Tax=Salvia splendens TaxID=180675 RepID=UPI001C269225|nr:ubiquitin carboxyl-terminal hydrolase 25-like isoform X1 [Salvia splendens]XP_042027645.1 ubiquitin carboxyl-terminal hydrolase 25-like isoform X1 [Salvia splendens]XP_042027646.1 ubiquitin carboxyl-terminal hydrolase 25-like isoform X1 [Salvia splendens]XP_042027647.1 ubiquitin carboxyl-terminal hydrolase 25-like isoform X1 [Salvia splendens]